MSSQKKELLWSILLYVRSCWANGMRGPRQERGSVSNPWYLWGMVNSINCDDQQRRRKFTDYGLEKAIIRLWETRAGFKRETWARAGYEIDRKWKNKLWWSRHSFWHCDSSLFFCCCIWTPTWLRFWIWKSRTWGWTQTEFWRLDSYHHVQSDVHYSFWQS